MKKILCYGDSNTFGFNPFDGSRYPENVRWAGLLKKILKNEYEIVEEGKNNRTGFTDNPDGFEFSSQRHFPKVLTKIDIDSIVVLAIGTNDLQFLFNESMNLIEHGLENLLQMAKKKVRNVILIPPVILDERVLNGYFSNQFDVSSINKSKKVGKIYQKLAQIYNCGIFDWNEFVSPSDVDGLHFTVESHGIIAQNLAKYISENY